MLTIGKVAELSNVTADAIRYYEKEGLIAPAQKSDAGCSIDMQPVDQCSILSTLEGRQHD